MKKLFILALSLVLLNSCSRKELADFIVYNGKIYTVDSSFSVVSAMAVKDGKILATGSFEEIQELYETQERINLEGKPVYPGFIDAHCHFLYFGLFQQRADLTGTKSFEDVISRLKNFRSENSNKEWIHGRGWDQNDWDNNVFPSKQELDKAFPDVPVYLERIDGHAALVNSEAIKRAGLSMNSNVNGGIVEVKNGELTGILIDNAMELVSRIIPKPTLQEKIKALKDAEKTCLELGLTTVDDAGLDKEEIFLIDSLQKAGHLKIRIYAMIANKKANLDHYLTTGPYKTDRLNVRSVKYYVDGALGSRGACLLEPYSDKPDQYGLLLTSKAAFLASADSLVSSGFQMNAHAIGDSANRMVLDVYGSVLKGTNDMRWRIEHAQIVNDEDLKKFGSYSVIPSVQPVHATSDMYWTKERLGNREQSGYRYKELIQVAGLIASGSDFPVEDVNPLYGFYAAVTRKDRSGNPENGFLPQNRISRKEAMMAMTTWAAFSNFEEKQKGTLEKGKFADFVVLDRDIMEVPENELFKSKVLYTYLNGRKVFQGLN